MKFLVTGSGTSGSWAVRGEQLGTALGAFVKPRAGVADLRGIDAVLVVKRCPQETLAALQVSGRPWAYDVLDAYPQPLCSAWPREQAIAWLRELVGRLRPDAMVWPNARMREDFGGGGKVVWHHHRPGQPVNPVRPRLEVVGYEGSERYLGDWVGPIRAACAQRGLRFVVNPPHLAQVDVVLALRGEGWNGYVQRHWKSAVKLANAHATGTPFIGAPESGYLEIATGAEVWIDRHEQLGEALDALAPQPRRLQVSAAFQAAAFHVEQAAAQMTEVLCALKS